MNKKQCNKCLVIKKFSEFCENRNFKSKIGPTCKACKALCIKEYAKSHYQNNKDYHKNKNKINRDLSRKVIQDFKTKSICNDCKVNYKWWQLQFDHLVNKEFGIGSSPGQFGKLKIIKEIQKCEVVCVNCHEKRTWLRRQQNKSKRNYISGKIKWLYELKESMSCLDCNNKFSYYQMQFYHVIGIKKFRINSGSIYGKSIKDLYIELMKCDLICGNCHSSRTHRRKSAT